MTGLDTGPGKPIKLEDYAGKDILDNMRASLSANRDRNLLFDYAGSEVFNSLTTDLYRNVRGLSKEQFLEMRQHDYPTWIKTLEFGHLAERQFLEGFKNLINTGLDWTVNPVLGTDIQMPNPLQFLYSQEEMDRTFIEFSKDLGPGATHAAIIVGDLAGWIGPGAPRAVMKGMEHGVTKMLQYFGKSKKLIDAGITGERVAQLVKEGKYVQEVAKALGLGKRAEVMGRIGMAMTQMAGTGLAAGMTQEQAHRQEAFWHGFVMDRFFRGINGLGGRAQAAMDKVFVTGQQKAAMDALRMGIQSGRASMGLLERTLRKLPGRVASSAIESVGFMSLPLAYSTLNPQEGDILSLLGRAFRGDDEAYELLMAEGLATFGTLLAFKHGVPAESWLTFRREAPDLNNLALRMESQMMKTGKVLEALPPEVQGSADLLLSSGWEVKGEIRDADALKPGVDLAFPGHEPIRLTAAEGQGLTMEVPAEVYKAVTGSESKKPVVVTGEAAMALMEQIGLKGLTQRAQAELYFQLQGYKERAAGDVWMDVDNLRALAVDLNGNILSRGLLDLEGSWKNRGPLPGIPPGASPNAPPQLEEWSRVANEARIAREDPLADEALGAALMLAARGNPESPSTKELREFFSSLDPSQVDLSGPGRAFVAANATAIAGGLSDSFHALQRIEGSLRAAEPGLGQEWQAGRDVPAEEVPGEVPRASLGGSSGQSLDVKGFASTLKDGDIVTDGHQTWRVNAEVGELVNTEHPEQRFPYRSPGPKSKKAKQYGLDWEFTRENKEALSILWDHLDLQRRGGKLRPPTQLEEQIREQAEQRTLEEIAGREDWRAVRQEEGGKEKVYKAVEEYVAEAKAQETEPTPTNLAKVFGISRDKAREFLSTTKAREGERGEVGFGLAVEPAKRAGESVLAGFDLGPRLLYERMVDRVARKAGPEGEKLKSQVLSTIDKIEELGGAAHDALKRAFRLTSPFSAKGREAQEFFEKGETVKGPTGAEFTRTNFQEMVEGGIPKDAPPERAKEIRAQYDKLFHLTGQMFEKAGGVTSRPLSAKERGAIAEAEKVVSESKGEAKKEAQKKLESLQHGEGFTTSGGQRHFRFKADPERHRALRQPGADLEEVLRDRDLRRDLAEHIAKEEGQDIEMVEKALADMVEKDPMAAIRGTKGTSSKTAAEFVRLWKKFPSTMTKEGKTYQLLETDVGRVMERMVQSMTHRAAVTEVFGQDLPTDVRQRLGIDKAGFSSAMRAAYEAGAEEGILRALMRTLSGMQADVLSPQGRKALGGYMAVERQLRSFMLSMSFLVNIPEPIATTWQFTGARRMLKSLLHRDPYSAYQEFVREGKIVANMDAYDIAGGRGFGALLRLATSGPLHLTQKIAEYIAVRSGEHMVQDIKDGKATWLDAWRLRRKLDFTDAEVQEILSGKGRQELYDAIPRRIRAMASASMHAGMRSRTDASQRFNAFIFANRFFSNRIWQMSRTTANWIRGLKSGKWKDAYAGSHDMVVFWTGAALSGQMQSILAYMLANLSVEEGWEQWKRAMLNDPLKEIGKGTAQGLLGGVAGTVARIVTDPEIGPGEKLAYGLRPLALPFNAIDAWHGAGIYRNQEGWEKAVTFLERNFPLFRKSKEGAVMLMSGGGAQILRARRQAWQWVRENKPEMLGGRKRMSDPDADDRKFRRALKDLSDRMVENGQQLDDPELMVVLKDALAVRTGREVASSLYGMRMLVDFSNEEKESMTAVIGEDNMRALHTFDNLLTDLAQEVGKQPGTKKEPEESLPQRLMQAGRQAELGAQDAWDDLISEVIENNVLRAQASMGPGDDIRQLTQAMSVHLESLSKHFTENEIASLRSAEGGAPTVARMLEGWLRRRIGNTVRRRRRRD